MDNVVPIIIRNQRSKMLRSLSEKKRRSFYNSQINKRRSILFESENKYGYIHGYTDNYVKVKIPWDPKFSNKLISAKMEYIDEEGFMRIKKKSQVTKKLLSYSDSYR